MNVMTTEQNFSPERLFCCHSDLIATTDFAVVDTNIESAVGIGANPCFIPDGRALSSIVRQRNEHSSIAL